LVVTKGKYWSEMSEAYRFHTWNKSTVSKEHYGSSSIAVYRESIFQLAIVEMRRMKWKADGKSISHGNIQKTFPPLVCALSSFRIEIEASTILFSWFFSWDQFEREFKSCMVWIEDEKNEWREWKRNWRNFLGHNFEIILFHSIFF
jgi:hypothetical protein